MSAKSTVKRLPPELRTALDRLLSDGRFTLTQVTAHVRALGAEVSRSAVHRYSQEFEQVAEDVRMTREMARALGRELGEVGDGQTTRLLVESLQALLLRARLQLGAGDELDPGAIAALARACKDLQTAFRSSVDVELKVRSEVAREAADAAGQVASEQGLSSETVDAIKARILGVAERPQA